MTFESERPRHEPTPSDVAKTLSHHGHAFHHRSIRAAQDAFVSQQSGWAFHVAEFPVEVRERQTRIDYVLKHRSGRDYLVVECKRVYDKFRRWCFTRVPYERRGNGLTQLIRERVRWSPMANGLIAEIRKEHHVGNTQNLGFELKDDKVSGSGGGNGGRGAIEDAATQVCLGLNGLIEYHLAKSRRCEYTNFDATIMPVILTTAKLYEVEVDLHSASLETGQVDDGQVSKPQEVPWVLYQYPVSPGLRHPIYVVGEEADPTNLGKVLEADYVRTIAVVQGEHFGEFLGFIDRILDLG
ncbi:hypothetical protein AB1L88_19700 [Tautonia sp. JC769]|uniref:hypothetical protein n=1 Tax=Tautonia sp. JC769 TaxID=3232135 RepID=UPI00345951BD